MPRLCAPTCRLLLSLSIRSKAVTKFTVRFFSDRVLKSSLHIPFQSSQLSGLVCQALKHQELKSNINCFDRRAEIPELLCNPLRPSERYYTAGSRRLLDPKP